MILRSRTRFCIDELRPGPILSDTMNRKLKFLIGIVGFLALLYGAGAWYFAGVLVAFQPKTLEEDRRGRRIKGLAQFGLEKAQGVELNVSGLKLRGLYLPAERGSKCGVVFTHGHRATRFGSVQYTALFKKRGCALLIYETRRHGKSQGDFATFGYHEKKDLHEILKWFSKKTGLPQGKIGLFGVSMGAAISLQAAAQSPEIAFVAVDSPFSSLRRIVGEQGRKQYGSALSVLLPGAFFFGGLRSGADLDDVSPLEYAKRIRVQVFILHSLTDTYTLPEHSRRIFAAVPHERKVLKLTKAGAAHSRDIVKNLPVYKQAVDDFLNKHAPGFR